MKVHQRIKRHTKIRKRVSGTPERPRLAVFRSNRFLSAQIIDDTAGTTLVSASDVKSTAKGRIERAKAVGAEIASLAKAKKISRVVFDRAGFLYAGRVQAFAEAARAGGLEF